MNTNEVELREAAETYIPIGIPLTQEQLEATNTMRRVCRFVLDAKGLPPKKSCGICEQIEGCKDSGCSVAVFNTALNACRPVLAARDMRIKELKEALGKIENDAGCPYMQHSGVTLAWELQERMKKIAEIARQAREG